MKIETERSAKCNKQMVMQYIYILKIMKCHKVFSNFVVKILAYLYVKIQNVQNRLWEEFGYFKKANIGIVNQTIIILINYNYRF